VAVRTLLVIASHKEADAERRGIGAAPSPAALTAAQPWQVESLAPTIDLVQSGVGKVNAGAAVAAMLTSQPSRYQLVLNLGIAGALPVAEGSLAEIGDVIIADRAPYADEGLVKPAHASREWQFQGIASMGFPLGPFDDTGPRSDARWTRRLHDALSREPDLSGHARVAPIATVSTCSGIDELACMIAQRTGAIAEAMEGAAVAHIATLFGVPWCEVRVISNTTGDRDHQRWDIPRSFASLQTVAACIARALRAHASEKS
jgi:futalosine hydrolase